MVMKRNKNTDSMEEAACKHQNGVRVTESLSHCLVEMLAGFFLM